MTVISEALLEEVNEYIDIGCQYTPRALGFQSMPEGYALMVNADCTHYFWICEDGRDSCIGSMWGVYYGAKEDQEDQNAREERTNEGN